MKSLFDLGKVSREPADAFRVKLSQLIVVIAISSLIFACQAQTVKSDTLKILLPLYIYPNWYQTDSYSWLDVVLAAQKVPIVAIINPNNGPGASVPNQDYVRGLKDLNQPDITILGYVYTKYGDRSILEVKHDIDIYYDSFGVKGIFLDESASSKDKIAYYQDIYRYIKTKDSQSQVVINPGTHTDSEYISHPAADTSVIFENFSQVWNQYQIQSYVSQNKSKHFASLIHSVPDITTMKSHIDLALERNIGYIYITDDSPTSEDGDPWNSLPSYWQEEVNYIQHKYNLHE